MQCLRRRAVGGIASQSQWHNIAPRVSFAPIQKRDLTISELDAARKGRERVVVLGSGWGGFRVSRDLDPRKYQIVVVSPRTYFVFTPLLAGTSVGTLEFRTVLEPVRHYRGRGVGAEFFQGWADSVDFEKRTLTIEESVEDPLQGRSLAMDRHGNESPQERDQEKRIEAKKGQLFDIDYDKLVITVGCYAQTFNTKGVKENAYFLKDVGDARKIRNRLLSCFENAALPTTTEEMKKVFLNFAVVGGGPTGIEWSAELYDMVHEDMARLYPELVKYVKITVYDVAPTVLSMFDKQLGQYAMKTFNRNGIEIKTSHHVEELRQGPPAGFQTPDGVAEGNSLYTLKTKEDGEMGVAMCVWSTGLMMNPFVANTLNGRVQRHEKTGGIMTNARMQPKNAEGKPITNVWALGDCAVIEGTAYPATAQVASQKAGWLAKRLNKGDIESKEFQYRDLGVMAYIGNRKAIAQTAGGDISGWMAWMIWRGAYVTKTISWRNKILIPIYWTINWLFGRDISRF